MNPSENEKNHRKTAYRVSLTSSSLETITNLLGQVESKLPGLKISKSDLVNWIIKTHSESFTDKEFKAIERDHFDPVKALEWAVAEAKKQQGSGKEVDLHVILSQKGVPVIRKSSRSKSKKRKSFDVL